MPWRTIPLLSWFLTKWRGSLRLRHTLVLSGMILLIMGLIFTDPDSDRVRVGGMPVPDIGPLLVTVPAPPTNLNYQAKVELGKPLVSDGWSTF